MDGFRSGTITQRVQTADGGIEIVVVQVNVVPVGPTDEMKLVARAAFETVNPHPMNMGPREIARLLRLMADRMDGLEKAGGQLPSARPPGGPGGAADPGTPPAMSSGSAGPSHAAVGLTQAGDPIERTPEMRKLIVSTFLTLDGVMQAPGGPGEDDSGGFAHGGWSVNYWDEQMGQVMGEAMSAPFDLVLGRKTYDIFAAYWPHASDEAGAKPLNEATKYVASRESSHAGVEQTRS